MKTLAALLILVISTVSSLAQPQLMRGVYSASGQLGFSSISSEFQNEKITISEFFLSPTIALFAFDYFELSLGPSYLYASSESTAPGLPSSSFSSTALGIRLGARYYVSSETLVPFVGAEGGLSWSKVSGSSGTSPFSPPLRIYSLQVGLDYFLTRNFAVEPSVQYGGMKTENTTSTEFSLVIGVKYFVL